jgi:hypothetical protein
MPSSGITGEKLRHYAFLAAGNPFLGKGILKIREIFIVGNYESGKNYIAYKHSKEGRAPD